jgi:L,D-peptidoglycan transpeptidase YkuD (ErfK/YbiS/YcfS/YnhG family)
VPSGSAVSEVHRELITVEAPSLASTWAVLELFERRGGCFSPVAGPIPARPGRAGLSAHHVEGDGTTPLGSYAIGPVMYGIEANPGVHYAWHHLVCGDWWDEDPASPRYDRFVHLSCGVAPPFGGDSEALWTEAPAYDAFAVIEFNADPAIPGRGSAIFLHEGTASPTDGCVSIAAAAFAAHLALACAGRRPADRDRSDAGAGWLRRAAARRGPPLGDLGNTSCQHAAAHAVSTPRSTRASRREPTLR